MGVRITKRVVDGLRATGAEFFAWDADLNGFGVRVTASGAKSYVVRYRAGSGRNAPVRRVTVCKVGELTPDEAREKAGRIVGDVAHGLDPAADRAREREAPTVSGLIDLFLAEHVEAKRKGGTAALYKDMLHRLVRPALGATKADKLTRAAVAKLHLSLSGTPYQANRVVAVLGSMYAFAGSRGLVPEGTNPARGVERYSEQGRERYLTGEELKRLGEAIREAETVGVPWTVDETKPGAKHVPKKVRRTVIGPHAAAALRLLIFTGARLREVLHLRWEHVDLERGLAFLADSKTGRKTLVLGAAARAVLADLPRVGAYVIAGESAGKVDEDGKPLPERPRSDLQRPWAAVQARAGLTGVRLHDLRHTFASFGAGGGFGLPVIGKLLGHTQAVTTARYAHLADDPLRHASDRIAGTIAAAMGEAGEGTSEMPRGAV